VVTSNEPNLAGGGLGGDSPAEGAAASAMGNSVVNSRLSVDLTMLKGLNEELTKLDGNVKKIKEKFSSLTKEAKDLTTQLNKAATAMGKVTGKGGGSGYLDMSKGMPEVAEIREVQMQSVERILSALGKGGGIASGMGLGGGGGGKILGGLKAFGNNPYVQVAGQALQAVGQTIDDRVDRNKSYALPADRLSVQLQQQYGMSQMDVMTQLRGPLRQYKLGEGGINELLAMQSRTGINARMQASSVESMRAMSGYAYSAGDITNYIESMGQADTVNRMFMMTGTSLYGIGGKQKSAQQVNQELIQRLGLNNREIIEGGRQSGSMLRQRMAMSGLDEGAQDMLLQYAESNISFREKGGKGFYDPSKKSDRERMGIEGNYATQAEETERVKINREEQMYKRQADNYAQMEKNIQLVNKALGEFEDRLSGVIGAKTSVRGFKGLLSPALGIAGAIGGAFLGGPAGAMAGYGIGSAVGGFFGDATGGVAASPGRIGQENPTTKPQNVAVLSQLKPILRNSLARLLSDRPGISIGGGYRSPDAQKKMFLERYYRTDEKTNTYWDGSYWKKKPGVPMAAPPGLSYHEIGLAADLRFATAADEAYLKANAAKYGLDEFSRHGEPWHVQPKSVPASRRNYDQGGESYGTDSQTMGDTKETGPDGQTGFSMIGGAEVKQQLSMSESMASFAEARQLIMFHNSPEGNYAGAGGGKNTGLADRDTKKDNKGIGNKYTPNKIPSGFYYRTTPAYGGWGYFVPKNFSSADIDALLQNETGGNYKVGGPSVTNSHGTFYGGFNISDYNWKRIKKGLAGLSNDKKGLHGKTYDTSNWAEHANDSIANQRLGVEYHLDSVMAHDGYEGIVKGTVNWPGVGKLPSKYLGPGTKISTTGDPSDAGYTPTPKMATSSSGKTVSNATTNNNSYNISPTINVNSTGSAPVDAARLAKEVSKLIEREMQMINVRNS